MDNYTFKTRRWLFISLINFCVVAFAGITMRYKINFPLPSVNQKYLLHAHSHFAFTGWVALVLMALLVNYLVLQKVAVNLKKYNWILWANCIIAYGMFVSFIIEGYDVASITFSTLSIFVSYFFIIYFWRDLKEIQDKSYTRKWFKAGLILWALSSLGAFSLAYLMANHIMVQDYYFSAIYFFLHFQYNGWFLFVCFGLLFSSLYRKGFLPSVAISKKLFMIMVIIVGPTYFLSILWLKLPGYISLIADFSAILQLIVLIYFFQLFPVVKKNLPHKFTKTTRVLWIMASIAFILKIILQMLSIIPFLSHFAFGFRPIVIGYLHLSFLCIISFFILGYINQILSEENRRISVGGLVLFVGGVLIQELVLMMQGLEAIDVNPVKSANMILFYAAITIGTGLVWMTLSICRKTTVSYEL